MKKIILVFGIATLVAAHQVTFAQTEGVIVYETKINLHRTLPEGRAELREVLPEFRTQQDQLLFNANESLFRPVIEDEPEEVGGGGVVMRIQRPAAEEYVNQEQMKRLRQEEFLGKRYLIEDSVRLTPWKIGTELKEIHGYTCRQATYYNEEQKETIVAWYTDALRPFLGPTGFNTLPGAVLAVDVDNGKTVITAKSIELRPLNRRELKAPTGGTSISQAEFQEMREKEFERIRANGGGVFIRN